MATLLDRCVTGGVLCVYRGSTASLIFNLTDAAGVAFDGTGRTYLLSVDEKEEPTDALTLKFTSAGAVATTVVTFPILTADVATVFAGFYEIRETDSGGLILTIDKGSFEIRQNIAK